jgi:hypothetical protein
MEGQRIFKGIATYTEQSLKIWNEFKAKYYGNTTLAGEEFMPVAAAKSRSSKRF